MEIYLCIFMNLETCREYLTLVFMALVNEYKLDEYDSCQWV